MYNHINRILIITDSGACLLDYNPIQDETSEVDAQLLSGFLSAIQMFSQEISSEINNIVFSGRKIYYRVLKLEETEFILIFMTDQDVHEDDLKVRMEYTTQIFVDRYVAAVIRTNFIDSIVLEPFRNELEQIVKFDRKELYKVLPISFLQILINELQVVIPIKSLERILKKYDCIYDNKTSRIIVPGDLAPKDEEKIQNKLAMSVKTLYGKKMWNNIHQKALNLSSK
ncbi:MAG: hypothetical protein ACXAC7_19640 [Candidatus Hodarchaeales archaeon]|jgi:hypothetical protein